MADYPAAATRVKRLTADAFADPSLSGPFGRIPPTGSDDERAAEAAVALFVEYYTRLGDARVCESARTWKILGDWPEHDSDLGVALRSGPATRRLALKVIVALDGDRWTLRLTDWGIRRDPIDGAGGRVMRTPGRTMLVVERDVPSPRPPVPRWPDEEVPV